MKAKIMISFLILSLALTVIACNPQLKNKGTLIYKTSQKIEGQWRQDEYPDASEFVTITPDNIQQKKTELRNIDGLSLDDGLAVYVALGECPTGGYNIQIREIRKADQTLVVTIKAISPDPEKMVTQVITYPYDLVRLSASEVQEVNKVLFYTVAGEKIKKEEI
ncbi:protease complex subunit PrcB family protein [Halanaerobacter jeridensis]|uniref:Type IV secretory pathway ATPase VirB11/archaellum biosynthesis ATPase n=1 Tax=Halanaerobacter jeridensis TaxID=706427 RepID=A0A938XPK4_9FIRM|nr:protease complex subunit PrcB family protein [Halanaerobacter jeridensis]MBM7556722.1 type IV secretory pathway ATPase VirB11/archaellum biosynthesis ATPase [Halanaerobacter jeridensis]